MSKPPKNKQGLRKAKNVVRGAFNTPSTYFQQIGHYGKPKLSTADLIFGSFANLKPEDGEAFFSWLQDVAFDAVPLFPSPPIKKASSLSLASVTKDLPLLVKARWVSIYLQNFKDKLEVFIGIQDRYEKAILEDSSAGAEAALAESEHVFGHSLWLIENRLNFLHRYHGLDAQKDYARSLRKDAGGKLGGVFAFYISERNEDGTVFSRFRSRVEQKISEWKSQPPVKIAYQYLLGAKSWADFSSAEASIILGAIASVSIVDAYCILLQLIEYIVSRPLSGEEQQLIDLLPTLLPCADYRVSRLKGASSGAFDSPSAVQCDVRDSPAYELFELAERRILRVDKAGNSQDAGFGLVNELSSLIELAVCRPPGFGKELDAAVKTLENLRQLRPARAVAAFLRFQAQYDVLLEASGGGAVTFNLPANTANGMLLNGLVSGSVESYSVLEHDKEAGELIRRVINIETSARRLLSEGDIDSAIATLTIIDLSIPFGRRRLTPLLARGYLTLGKIDEAVTVIAETCVVDSDLFTFMPVSELLDDLRTIQFRIKDKLGLAVFLDFASRTIAALDLLQPLQFAYEDAVLSLGVERPSEMAQLSIANERKSCLVHFLRRVAVPSVMDVSFWLFKSSRSTWEERLQVCTALMALDAEESSEYQHEIANIVTRLNIEDGLDQIDRSRVFVDLVKLKRWAETEVQEGFQRYKALTRSGVGYSDPADFERLLKDFLAGQAVATDSLSQYPRDEAGQILIELYETIGQAYLHDPEFGLDAYLSMRVRHGSLAGHLRGPFEEAALLGSRDQGRGKQQSNRLQKDRSTNPTAGDEELQGCIRKFAERFDRVVDELIKERLQIRRADKPKGMFVFEQSPVSIYYLRANIDEATDLDQFLNKTFDLQDIYLGASLNQVREYLAGEFADLISEAIETLKDDVSKCLAPEIAAEIQNRILSAVSEWQASLARVSSWFAHDIANGQRGKRTMQEIVEIAIQATKNARRGFDPVLDLDIVNVGWQSPDAMIEMTHIIFTILDNVWRHSAMGSNPKVQIKIEGDFVGEDYVSILVRVANELEEGFPRAAQERKLAKIREQIASGEYRSRVKLEGGTGFLKLKRSIAADPRQTLDFGFDDDGFFVEIKLIFRAEIQPASMAA